MRSGFSSVGLLLLPTCLGQEASEAGAGSVSTFRGGDEVLNIAEGPAVSGSGLGICARAEVCSCSNTAALDGGSITKGGGKNRAGTSSKSRVGPCSDFAVGWGTGAGTGEDKEKSSTMYLSFHASFQNQEGSYCL